MRGGGKDAGEEHDSLRNAQGSEKQEKEPEGQRERR